MAFMKPYVTDKQKWVEVDGTCGITFIPCDMVSLPEEWEDVSEVADIVGDYYEGGAKNVWSVQITEGYGARMSAPGYLDCTEWSVFDTEREAEEYLKEYYGDDDEDEESEDND